MMGQKAWSEMTPEEKREQRFKKWLNNWGNGFPSAEAEKAYKTRVQRLIDVYSVREPDRVPVNMPVGNLPFTLFGLDMRTAMYDIEKALNAVRQFNEKYSAELEYTAMPFITPGRVLEILDYKIYAWPGHGLPESATGWQYVEGEYMMETEYDDLIRDPSDFWMRVYLPRVFGTLEPMRQFQTFTSITENVHVSHFMPLANPAVQEMLQKMLEAGREYQRVMQIMSQRSGTGLSLSFPSLIGGFAKAPFDTIGDTLRGTKGIMQDMFRRPDKLLEALDVVADLTIAAVLKSPNIERMTVVSYPLHKGADGWMSKKQFETFYWPSLKKVMNALINEGLVQSLFAEGSFETRLEYLNEFPKGSVTVWFDRTDMGKAKKVLGDRCCIQGNVPSSMLVTGSPAAVKEYCRKLIETCGRGGGYILAAGCVPDNPKLENLQAMIAAAREYGVYRH